MSDPQLQILRDQRARTVSQHREFLDAAQRAGRFDGMDQATDARFLEEITGLNDRIAEAETRRARQSAPGWAEEQRKIAAITGTDVSTEGSRHGGSDFAGQFRSFLKGEIRSLDVDLSGFRTHVRPDGRYEVRALGTGSLAVGAALVPSGFQRFLYEELLASSGVRQAGPTTLITAGGESLTLPRVVSAGTAAVSAEGSALGGDEPSFGTLVLGAHKYGCLDILSSELAADAGLPIEEFLAKDIGRALGDASGEAFSIGSGTSEPAGIVPTCTAAGTGAAGTAGQPSADDLIDLFFSIRPAYQARGTWLTSSAGFAAAMKLKDGEDRYILSLAGLASGAPTTLLGRPVIIDPWVPAPAVGVRSWVFGDVESGYVIRQVGTVRLDRSQDAYFSTDQIAWRGVLRVDGGALLPGALRCFVGGGTA